MRTPKTKEIKIIQANYGFGWEDVAEYEKSEYSQIKHDLAEYRTSSVIWTAIYRVITRRVPICQ